MPEELSCIRLESGNFYITKTSLQITPTKNLAKMLKKILQYILSRNECDAMDEGIFQRANNVFSVYVGIFAYNKQECRIVGYSST